MVNDCKIVVRSTGNWVLFELGAFYLTRKQCILEKFPLELFHYWNIIISKEHPHRIYNFEFGTQNYLKCTYQYWGSFQMKLKISRKPTASKNSNTLCCHGNPNCHNTQHLNLYLLFANMGHKRTVIYDHTWKISLVKIHHCILNSFVNLTQCMATIFTKKASWHLFI